ncbi:MAG: DUF3990 domain-containing protein [Eubacteriales bacterium]
MKLYHGSNIEGIEPKILQKSRALDFGAGFYMTSSKEQAIRWAHIVDKRNGNKGNAILNEYYFDDNIKNSLKTLVFESANSKWLDFVVANRNDSYMKNRYDIVIGPVANDTTLTVINDYMDGRYSKRDAIRFLKPQKLTDQYAFLTNDALKLLKFEGSERA